MARPNGGVVVLAVLAGLVAGCGIRIHAQRDPWRGQAEEACLAHKLVQATAYTQPMPAIDAPGTCGMDHPFRVAAFGGGAVGVSSHAVLACPAISTVDRWLAEIVQPAAATYFGTSVAEIRAGSYSCRSVNNQRGGHLSEHAFGNAVDLMALHLADGREINVERGWRGDPREQDFLREIFLGACRYFTTVLAPGSDMFHYNHIHMDLARHARGHAICKPVLKWTPRAPEAVAADHSPQWPAGEGARAPLERGSTLEPALAKSSPQGVPANAPAPPRHGDSHRPTHSAAPAADFDEGDDEELDASAPTVRMPPLPAARSAPVLPPRRPALAPS